MNIEYKLGENAVVIFYHLVSMLKFVYKKPLPKGVEKDLPILAAALAMQCDYLITLDKKDFKKEPLIKAVQPLKMYSPGEYLQENI